MDEQMHQILEGVRDSVAGAVGDVLGKPTAALDDWLVVERIRNTSELGATVGFASMDWQGAVTLGLAMDEAQLILPGGDEDYVFDALGEVGNTICGVLAAHPQFVEVFGFLEQTPPVFSRGGAWLPRTQGISGTVRIDDVATLCFGFSIRHTT